MNLTFDTDESILDFSKKIAKLERESIASNDLNVKFVWYDPEKGPRLFALPESINYDDRPNLMRAMVTLGMAMPDEMPLLHVADACMATSMTRKDGSEWGAQGMQNALIFQTEDAELVKEVLQVTIGLNGWVHAMSCPYIRTPDGIDFQWDQANIFREDPSNPGSARLRGYFPEVLRLATGEAKTLDRVIEMFGDEVKDLMATLSDEAIQMHQICASVKAIAAAAAPLQVAIPAWTEEEADIIAHSFGEAAVQVNED